ncbi:hypothetical protein TRIUR3_06254 [Triticum urartu]|uniref:Uncharacterized protein n=1 Tax=Triticum urartu TaxID=4572 RepID=M7ZSP5_TRIUA|nr:hypothetical protein TRIUR3_06254 [Triticum urartu]
MGSTCALLPADCWSPRTPAASPTGTSCRSWVSPEKKLIAECQAADPGVLINAYSFYGLPRVHPHARQSRFPPREEGLEPRASVKFDLAEEGEKG